MEELYKNELQILKDFANKEQYVPLGKIMEVFQNPSEELLDDIVKYLENEGIEITRESEDLPDDELLVEKVDDDFEGFGDEIEFDEELVELAAVVESEIKVADFDDFVSSSQAIGEPSVSACSLIRTTPALISFLAASCSRARSAHESVYVTVIVALGHTLFAPR